MAYVRHNWTCGEVINDTRMNNIEDGIEEALNGGGLVIEVDHTSGHKTYYNKTWQQAMDALAAGNNVVVVDEESARAILGISYDSESGYQAFALGDFSLNADEPNGFLYYDNPI